MNTLDLIATARTASEQQDNLATTILLEMLADKLEEYYWENLIESPQERYS
tara:strand:+ start:263 stop:415 length:153 start_codon:yes stop_codon:yes gene_type:complete